MPNETAVEDKFATMVEAVAAADIDLLPPEIVDLVSLVIADSVGVILGGSKEPEMRRLLKLLTQSGFLEATDAVASATSHRATVLSSLDLKADPGRAAFLNATSGSFLELDEGMKPTGHAAMHVVPAALAVGESVGATGREVFRAIFAGYEANGRLFQATKLNYPVHPHGHLGAVGAAIATALLLDIDPLEPALIALTTPILPIWDACYEGATARNTYMGHAAQTGVMAGYLSQSGFRGSNLSYKITFGELVGQFVDTDALSAPLDYERPRIKHNYFKQHSACALSHAAIDAVMSMDLPLGIDIDDVLVETVENNMKLNRMPAENSLSTRFSLQYAVATALLLRRTDPAAFAEYRRDVAGLAGKIDVVAAQDLEADWPHYWAARVTVRWRGGSATQTVRNPEGHHGARFDVRQLKDKFTQLTAGEFPGLWETLIRLRRSNEILDLRPATIS